MSPVAQDQDGRVSSQTQAKANRGGGLRMAILIGLAGALPAFLGVWALTSDGPSVEEQRTDLQAYLEDLKPLAEETGFLVIHGLRAGINDIATGGLSDDILRRQPVGWRRDLEQIQDKFRALEPPSGLEEAHERLIASLDGYIAVTHRLEEAAQAPKYRRRMLVRRAANLGEDTDDIWDRGAYQIQYKLDELGEDMVIWLPDPTLNPDADDYVDGDPDERRPNDFLEETRDEPGRDGD